MTDGIDSLLTRLPEPAPPPALLASVMARIERERGRPTMATGARTSEIDDHNWVWAVLGIVVVLGLTAYRWVTGAEPPDVVSSRIGFGRLERMPVEAADALLLAAGLWLFLVGLFAPVARHEG
jgi:hypothetical protein